MRTHQSKSAEAVAAVVVVLAGQVGAHVEGLVAHEHALPERTPGEPLGRREAAAAHEASLGVDQVGVAIDDGGQLLSRPGGTGHQGEGVGAVEGVAGVEEYDVLSCGHVDGLVHGVVESVVGLADTGNFVWHAGHGVTFLVVVDVLQGIVLRVSVDNHVFHLGVGLLFDTVDGAFDQPPRVVGDGCDGYF